MKNIGNNILDNLKQMRRPYVAPAMLVEEVVEEGEMLAGSPVTGTGGDTEQGEGDWAKSNDLIFFDDEAEEWVEDEE